MSENFLFLIFHMRFWWHWSFLEWNRRQLRREILRKKSCKLFPCRNEYNSKWHNIFWQLRTAYHESFSTTKKSVFFSFWILLKSNNTENQNLHIMGINRCTFKIQKKKISYRAEEQAFFISFVFINTILKLNSIKTS